MILLEQEVFILRVVVNLKVVWTNKFIFVIFVVTIMFVAGQLYISQLVLGISNVGV